MRKFPFSYFLCEELIEGLIKNCIDDIIVPTQLDRTLITGTTL